MIRRLGARRIAFRVGLALLLLPALAAPLPAQDGVRGEAPARVAARPAHPARPAAIASLNVVSELAIDRWLRPGEFAWNDEGVTTGRTVIVVNIRARVLSAYRGGIEIGRSSIIYGADNKPTPHGSFTILERRADHVSNLYDAPMPHMLRLTWDGIAIHGSPALADDLATRGCIGLPREFARLLFSVAHVGDTVIVWSGEASA